MITFLIREKKKIAVYANRRMAEDARKEVPRKLRGGLKLKSYTDKQINEVENENHTTWKKCAGKTNPKR
jgi:hypothetical protein